VRRGIGVGVATTDWVLASVCVAVRRGRTGATAAGSDRAHFCVGGPGITFFLFVRACPAVSGGERKQCGGPCPNSDVSVGGRDGGRDSVAVRGGRSSLIPCRSVCRSSALQELLYLKTH
jgi:hypothetical protein